MKIINTEIEGVMIIENFHSTDQRGSFIKTYTHDFFMLNGLCTEFKESYYSVSMKNTIRGMHFQLPPNEHDKLVFVPKGEVIDVILDLRKGSVTYGKSISILLNDKNNCSVYIPKGLAHGFLSLENETIMVYNVSTVYFPESDFGIHYDSFGFNWNIENPIVSNRDRSLTDYSDFLVNNPF